MTLRSIVACAAVALVAAGPANAALRTAVFAGGCFWSIEKAFEALPGVRSAVSGYAGGTLRDPTYQNHAGHLEAVRVTYDDAKVSYAALTEFFFRQIDPTDADGQFCDRGAAYRTAVFVAGEAELNAAQKAKAKVAQTLGKPVATRVLRQSSFWPAEAYHQDYAKKNPVAYERYRIGCRRDASLKAVWAGR